MKTTTNRWDYGVPKYIAAAQALQRLAKDGLIKRIGLTNFDLPRTQELLAAGVSIASHQVQLSLLDDRPLRSGLVEHARR
jgi:diketogulonate reductase-like aldo/keto reductase